MSFGKVVLGFTVLVLLVVGVTFWWEVKSRQENVETIGVGWQDFNRKSEIKPERIPQVSQVQDHNWSSKPAGKSLLAIGTDASASMTPASLVKQASMLDSVVSHVSGDNLLSLYTMGSKVYRHNTGSSEAGRAIVLKNWKDFLPYKQDSLFTNCSLALASMINDALPLIQKGYVAEVILITDGKHEPPPEQNDQQVQSDVQSVLNSIPATERNHLRIDIIEVGKLLRYSGQVAGILPSGFAATRRADSWDDVVPIVLNLQDRIEGRFSWVNAPAAAYRIGAPGEDSPKVLGPFTFDLAGPDKVDVQVDLTTNDLVDSSEQLVLEASIDNGAWVNLTRQIALKNRSLVRFRFYENSSHHLPSNWFAVWRREYSLKLQPVDNLIPLVNQGEVIKVEVEKPAFVWELGAWLLFGALTALLGFIFLIFRCVRIVRRHYQRPRAIRKLPARPVLYIGFDGQSHVLMSGQTVVVGQVVFTASADGLSVEATPQAPVRLERQDVANLRKISQALASGETASIDPQSESKLVNLADEQEYRLTPSPVSEEVVV